MKKVSAIILVFCLLFQVGAVTVFAENAEINEQTVIVSDIHFSPSEEAGSSSTKLRIVGFPSVNVEIIGEEWSCPEEIVISGENIQITDGKYSYKLTLRADKTLTFDNDLEIVYQGVNGRYQLNYEIDETDNHIMIVTGTFENIIIASPLLDRLPDRSKERIVSHISEDAYFYQLILRTAEGFSFTNRLRFLFDSKPFSYSTHYTYDLMTDQQTLIINAIGNLSENESEIQTTSREEAVSSAEPDVMSETTVETTAPQGEGVGQTSKLIANKFAVTDATRITKAGKTTAGVRIIHNGAGSKTYQIKKVNNKKYAGCFTIDKANGRITISPKTPRGRYVVTVQAQAAQTKNCKASSWKTANVTIVVI